MTTELSRVAHQGLALLPPELPLQLTASELRNPFRLDTTRADGVSTSRKVFVPPTDGERQELETVRWALAARLEPCSSTTIGAQILRLANHHQNKKSAEEWKAICDDWYADLREFSDAHLQQAFTEHRRTSEFFPKISEIRQRCLELQDLDRCRMRRVNVSLTGKESTA